MKAARSLLLPAAVLVNATLTFSAHAVPRCQALQYPFDRIACEKARQSPDALRQYVWKTRGLHHLDFWDYMTEADLDRYHVRSRTADRGRSAGGDEGRADTQASRN